MKYGSLGKRVNVGAIGIPVILGLTWIGRIPFLLLCLAITTMALWEYYQIASNKDVHPSKIWGVISLIAIGANLYFFKGQFIEIVLFVIVIVILILELFKNKINPLLNSAVTLFGVFYLSLFYGILMIREFLPARLFSYKESGVLVIYIFLIIWICDSGAYLLGARFGKRPLFLRVSPKKTWEGAIWGFIMGMISAVGFKYALLPKLLLIDAIVIGLIIGTVGQISDLIESLFKRDANVKDSSSILPGHGGILDRFDSPILIGPAVYFYLYLMLHIRQ